MSATLSTFICCNLKILQELLPQSILLVLQNACLVDFAFIYLPYSWAKMPQAIFPTLICQLASCWVLPRVTRMMGTQEEGGRDFLIPVCYSDCYHVGSDSLLQQ